MISPAVDYAASHPLDDRFVLQARSMRPGALLEETSRFRDNTWRLDAAIVQRHLRALMLNFEVVPARYRPTAKELCYAMLSGDLPPGEPRLAIVTIHKQSGPLGAFLRWLHTREPGLGRPAELALADLTGQDLVDYQRHLQATVRNQATRTLYRSAVRYLWRYRTALTADRLLFDPVHVEGWGESGKGRRRAENATDRIPEAVHGPLLAWALRFIDDFAEDILAADREWRRLRNPARRASTGNRDAAEKIRLRLDDYLARRRPLPGYKGAINMQHLAEEIGCGRSTCERYRAQIVATAAVVGVSDRAFFDIQIASTLDGHPWIAGIATTSEECDNGLARLARMLQAAAGAVILFLSGMRDSEVKHLRRGCLRVQRDERGQPYRWTVTSLAFKGEDDPAGVKASWVVGAPAARAIEILERLQPLDVDLMFAPLDHSPRNGKASRREGAALTTSATNSQLNEFVRWINDYCAAHGRADSIPLINKGPWRLKTSQFRRTLAWFIARRPGGAIAGAIAYRHQGIQMFEGYAGTSESGFRAEVESEQALARGEHLLAIFDRHEHKKLAGPAAEEAAQRLEKFGEQTRFPGKVVSDQRRLDRLMKRDDPAIYPGKYVTCVYKHETALCQQRRDSHGELRPNLGSCKPLRCRNVALTPGNLGNLREEIVAIDGELAARPLLPPLLEGRLRARQAEITEFIDRHTQQEAT